MVRILLGKINHINSINHKIILKYLEPPSAGKNHQESFKCASTRLTLLELYLGSIFSRY